jgi:hypothetical protein
MKTEQFTISIYIGSLIIIHLVYIAVILGIFVTIPSYIRLLNIFIQVFLCVILMIRFHPFRENPKLHNGDTMFIFGAGFVLFTNVVLVELLKIAFVEKKIHEILQIVPKPVSKIITTNMNLQ